MNSYVRSILKKDCYQELHELFVECANPIKEITESMGAFLNMLYVMGREKMNSHKFYHIGDGSKCTTGALFSFMSKSVNISIDPEINEKIMNRFFKKWNPIHFYYYKKTWEEFLRDTYNPDPPIVETTVLADKFKKHNRQECSPYSLVMVHSHVNTIDVFKRFPEWKYAYVNPCCNFKAQVPDIEYLKKNNINCILSGRDKNIMSERNEVFIYENKTI